MTPAKDRTMRPERMQADRAQALAVIGRIYDASVQPAHWPDTVGSVVAFVGGSKGLLYSSVDPADQGGFAVPYGLDDEAIRQLRDSHVVNALWSRTAVQSGLLEDRRSMPRERTRAGEAPALYREFVGDVGMGRVCTGVALGSQGGAATACTVFRSASEPPFDQVERERMRLLVPHLARAVEVMDRLGEAEGANKALEASLDRIACGVLLIGLEGEVLFANHTARRIIEERDGIALVEARDGHLRRRLVFDDCRARNDVHAMLSECLKHSRPNRHGEHHHATVRRPSGRTPYLVRCAALGPQDRLRVEHDSARGIAIITDPEEGAFVDRHALKHVYRLTDAEASLAEHLCGGQRLADAAEALGITLNTARAQLKTIFQKTGASRQPELVKLLLTLSAYR
jgi:DNA-binding CsgD family transcriptional regulator